MENGKNGWMLRFLTGALWLVIFTWITVMTNNVIANDIASRKRDDDVKTDIKINSILIARIETKLETILDNQKEFKDILKRAIPNR